MQPSSRSRSFPQIAVVPLLALSACAASHASFESEVAESVAARATSAESLALAFELAAVAPLAAAPPREAASADPSRLDFWRAAAFAFAPEVRAARHEYEEAVDVRVGAGAPSDVEFDLASAPTEAAVTFDLLGLLGSVGIGPSAAAKRLADSRVFAALAALEQAVFDADFEVERARLRVMAAAEKVAALDRLAGDVDADVKRVTILAADGFIPPAEAEEALGQAAAAHARKDAATAELASARAALAREVGIEPAHPALDRVFGPIEIEAAAAERALDARVLLARIPELRRARLDYAVAEADLRLATAGWWPDVAIGPKLIADDLYLPGGVARVDVPWPTAVIADIRAADHRRERARELVEQSLVDWENRFAERVAIARVTARAACELAPAADAGSDAAWRAARARFATDPARLPEWSLALERRLPPLVAAIDARRDAAIAAADVRQLDGIGPTPGGEP